MKVLCFIAFLVCAASAQKIHFGGCPENIQVKQNFDLKQYVGQWYEIEKNPVPFEAGMKCNKAFYEDKGDYVSVINSGIKIRSGKNNSIEGSATVVDKEVPSKLKVVFKGMPFSADYWVLDTDYTQYSIVYSCFSVLNIFNAEYLWVLSRETQLDVAVSQNIHKFLDDNKIDRSRLVATQQDC